MRFVFFLVIRGRGRKQERKRKGRIVESKRSRGEETPLCKPATQQEGEALGEGCAGRTGCVCARACVCVCVRVRVRACVCVYVCLTLLKELHGLKKKVCLCTHPFCFFSV